MVWSVVVHPEAEPEYETLDAREALAVDSAIDKLQNAGPRLGFPHSSAVKGADKLRELRPRGGRSVTGVFYRQFGDVLVIGAYGPEAEHDPKGFKRACRAAQKRLDEVEE